MSKDFNKPKLTPGYTLEAVQDLEHCMHTETVRITKFEKLVEEEIEKLLEEEERRRRAAAPVSEQPSDFKNKVIEALGLPANGLNRGRRVTFSDEYLLGLIAEMVKADADLSDQPGKDARDAARYRTIRSMLNRGSEVETIIESALRLVFPDNEERNPTPEELDAVVDAVGAALAQQPGKEGAK